jgi:tetratricopeptide (TPR) repeat protein
VTVCSKRTRALTFENTCQATLCNYALLLQGVRRDFKRAWQQLQIALRLSPGYPPALTSAALLMHTSFDQPAVALHMYQSALERSPKHAGTLVNLAHLYWHVYGC